VSGPLSSTDLTRLEAVLRTLLAAPDHGGMHEWGDACWRGLGALFPAGSANLIFATPTGVQTHTAHSPGDQRAYLEYYAGLDRAAARVARERVEVAHRWSVVPRDAVRGTEFYEDFLRPRRLGDAFLVNTFDDDPRGALRHRVILNFERPVEGPERDRVLTLLRLVHPAFKAATAAWDRHGATLTGFTAVLDGLGTAAQLCDARGRALHRTPALQRMLAADPGAARLGDELARVARGVCAALTRRGGVAAGATVPRAVTTVRTAGGCYDLRATASATASGGPCVVVDVAAKAAEPVAEAALRERHGLTRQEASVARLLAERRSNREIAAELGISPNTARTHVERVRRKLGVGRRTEVAAQLHGSGAAPAAAAAR
jgi:DNA-binding CsgD family transcriptional regulator